MSETISKKGIFIIGALIVSTIGFAGFSGITLANYQKVQGDSNYWETAYEDLYEDYLDEQDNSSSWETAYDIAYQNYLDAQANYQQTLNDLFATEQDLDDALADLQIAEQNLQNAEAELALIEENTGFTGSFYVLSQFNRNFDLLPTEIRTIYSYSDYFFYRLTLEHPLYNTTSSYSEGAQLIAGYCRPSSVYSIASVIEENVNDPLDNESVIDGLLTYCQDRGDYEPCIHYVSDGEDFAQYPVETLCEGCGDCEDKSILFASLVRSLGFDVRICIVPGHCFVAVKLDSPPVHGGGWHIARPDGNYYTCETTGYGWLIGDLPPAYQGESVYSYQVL